MRTAALLAGVLAAMAAAPPTAALSNAAEYLLAEQLNVACEGGPGEVDRRNIEEHDLTGDGKLDFIIDHAAFACDAAGGRNPLCGAAHCPLLFYVREGPLLRFVEEVASIGVEVGPEKVPIIRTIGFDYRWIELRWDGQTFAFVAAGEPGSALVPGSEAEHTPGR